MLGYYLFELMETMINPNMNHLQTKMYKLLMHLFHSSDNNQVEVFQG